MMHNGYEIKSDSGRRQEFSAIEKDRIILCNPMSISCKPLNFLHKNMSFLLLRTIDGKMVFLDFAAQGNIKEFCKISGVGSGI